MIPVDKLELNINTNCNMRCSYCRIKKEQVNINIADILLNSDSLELSLFGGEPLTSISTIEDSINIIKSKQISDYQKERLLKGITTFVTNGTLIKKNLDFIKKYNFSMIISLDGPKYINDANRKYIDGRGSYDDILEAINICIENGIDWKTQTTIGYNNINHITEIFQFTFDMMYKQIGDYDKLIEKLSHDFDFMLIVKESDFSDSGIDTILNQMYKVIEYIRSMDYLSNDQKKGLIKAFLQRDREKCPAGDGYMTIDNDLNIYPCRGFLAIENKEQYKIGNIHQISEFKMMNNMVYQREVGIKMKNIYLDRWCVSNNLLCSGSIFYANSKFTTFIKEYNRMVSEIIID